MTSVLARGGPVPIRSSQKGGSVLWKERVQPSNGGGGALDSREVPFKSVSGREEVSFDGVAVSKRGGWGGGRRGGCLVVHLVVLVKL